MLDSESRVNKLDKDITGLADVCSSGGPVFAFPEVLKKDFLNFGIGLIVCIKGSFDFHIASDAYTAVEGETVFLPVGKVFRVIKESDNLEVGILIYNIEPIRDVIGNMAHSLNLYYRMSPDINCVWSTGNEKSIMDYISLIGTESPEEENEYFAANERKLLLLSLTYRLCDIFQKKFLSGNTVKARSTEIFLNLIKLIDKNYMKERGVEFYADKLCLTPKYLSGVSKSISGYTVQELVFKAIVRKSISLLDSTDMTVQEISETMNFPNPSSFGTFFKKHVGMSPQKYRERSL